MKRMMFKNNEKAFTLIEMMIVLIIISVLLLIAVPNITKNQEMANDKGCEATKELVRAQMIAYEIDQNKKIEDENELKNLVTEKYIETLKCPNSDEDLTLTDLDIKYDGTPITPDE